MTKVALSVWAKSGEGPREIVTQLEIDRRQDIRYRKGYLETTRWTDKVYSWVLQDATWH